MGMRGAWRQTTRNTICVTSSQAIPPGSGSTPTRGRLYPARIQGIAHGISREQGSEALLPYVSPSVDWIRLQRRIPVRIILQDLPGVDGLFMGTDARTLVIY